MTNARRWQWLIIAVLVQFHDTFHLLRFLRERYEARSLYAGCESPKIVVPSSGEPEKRESPDQP